MSNIRIALLSADEFEDARALIPELSDCPEYNDWLDRREGQFMGYSLGGVGAELFHVRLQDFLNWCGEHEVYPTEAALDVFAVQSDARANTGSAWLLGERRRPARQADTARVNRPV